MILGRKKDPIWEHWKIEIENIIKNIYNIMINKKFSSLDIIGDSVNRERILIVKKVVFYSIGEEKFII